MKLRQISVFVENRIGRVAELTHLLGENNINIRAVSLADTHDFGIVRLIVNHVDSALEILREHKFTVHDTEVVAISIPDEPDGLAKVLFMLSEEELDVGYLYGFVEQTGKNAILIFRFEEVDRAIEIINSKGLRTISGEELYKM